MVKLTHPSLLQVITLPSFLNSLFSLYKASLVAQMVKNLPARQETRMQSLGREGPLEEEMATHTSVLAWRIPRTEEPGGLQSVGSQRVGHDWAAKHAHIFTHN